MTEERAIQKGHKSVEILVDSDGAVYIDKDRVYLSDIDRALRAVVEARRSERILLRADSSVPYGRVAEVLCRASNAVPDKQVILVTEKARVDGKD